MKKRLIIISVLLVISSGLFFLLYQNKHGKIFMTDKNLANDSSTDSVMTLSVDWEAYEKCQKEKPELKDSKFVYLENTSYDKSYTFTVRVISLSNKTKTQSESFINLKPGETYFLGWSKGYFLENNDYNKCNWLLAENKFEIVGEQSSISKGK